MEQIAQAVGGGQAADQQHHHADQHGDGVAAEPGVDRVVDEQRDEEGDNEIIHDRVALVPADKAREEGENNRREGADDQIDASAAEGDGEAAAAEDCAEILPDGLRLGTREDFPQPSVDLFNGRSLRTDPAREGVEPVEAVIVDAVVLDRAGLGQHLAFRGLNGDLDA